MKKGKTTTTSGMDWNVMLGLTQRLKQDGLLREMILVTLGCYLGLRIGDLLRLRWCELIDKDEFVLTEQKTKKARRISLNQKVKDALTIFASDLKSKGKFDPTGLIICNRWGRQISISYINRRLKYIFFRYNVKVQNPSSHTLRKSFGKAIWENDAKSERSLTYLSMIFSHSSPAITRRYIGVTAELISDLYLSL